MENHDLSNGGYLRLVLNGVYSRDLPVYFRFEDDVSSSSRL